MEILSTLNIIDVIIVLIMLLSLISGMYKGFISSMLATLGFGGAVVVAYKFCPQLANLFQSNNGLMNSLSYYLGAPEMLAKLADASVGEVGRNSALLTEATNKLSALPQALVSAFRDNVTSQLFSTLNLTNLGDYLSQTVIVALVYVVSFLLIFALCYLLALLIVNLFNNLLRFPLLKHFDWLFGGLLGLVRGAVITVLALTVIPMLLSLMDLNILDEFLATSKFAPFFTSTEALSRIIAQGFLVK